MLKRLCCLACGKWLGEVRKDTLTCSPECRKQLSRHPEWRTGDDELKRLLPDFRKKHVYSAYEFSAEFGRAIEKLDPKQVKAGDYTIAPQIVFELIRLGLMPIKKPMKVDHQAIQRWLGWGHSLKELVVTPYVPFEKDGRFLVATVPSNQVVDHFEGEDVVIACARCGQKKTFDTSLRRCRNCFSATVWRVVGYQEETRQIRHADFWQRWIDYQRSEAHAQEDKQDGTLNNTLKEGDESDGRDERDDVPGNVTDSDVPTSEAVNVTDSDGIEGGDEMSAMSVVTDKQKPRGGGGNEGSERVQGDPSRQERDVSTNEAVNSTDSDVHQISNENVTDSDGIEGSDEMSAMGVVTDKQKPRGGGGNEGSERVQGDPSRQERDEHKKGDKKPNEAGLSDSGEAVASVTPDAPKMTLTQNKASHIRRARRGILRAFGKETRYRRVLKGFKTGAMPHRGWYEKRKGQ